MCSWPHLTRELPTGVVYIWPIHQPVPFWGNLAYGQAREDARNSGRKPRGQSRDIRGRN
jgi:hypothetical protein